MKIRLIIGLTILSFLSFTARAQEETRATHPIDAAMEQCLAKSHATMPRAECYSTASQAWETNLTNTYALLLRQENASNKQSLKVAQNAWEKYRDAEFDYIGQIYAAKKGTGYIAARIIGRMEIVKARALRLETRLRSVK